MENASRVQRLITEQHMTLATADESGKPWVSPVFFAHDPETHRFYWVSSRNAVHSSNIRHRPEVCIVIFVPKPADALYLDARAVEVDEEAELQTAVALLAKKKQPDKFKVKSVEDVTGDRAWRIYRATPEYAYTREDAYEDGQAVTVRQEVALP